MNSFFSERTAEPLIYKLFEEVVNLSFLVQPHTDIRVSDLIH